MGDWRRDPDHRQWERWDPAAAFDWPPDAEDAHLEPCRCWLTGCVLTRHLVPVDGAPADPDAPDARPYRYEIFHARAVLAPKPEPKPSRDPSDRKRRAAGER